ncbi:MAG: thymidylate kinase [Chloroflexota bacterium]|nr:thymidylate kinase [Chloroflexota bacterium]
MISNLPDKSKGKFIVLEGLDGSGKSTQYLRLCEYLSHVGHNLTRVDFPNYQGSFHGELIGRYLRGEFGEISQVNPYFSAWLYAGDRLEAKEKLVNGLEAGHTLVANRYTGSNLAYHSVKLPPAQRPGFLQWIKALEYETNGLPKEDLVVYFHLPVTLAQQMVDRKASRSYTTAQRDLHERNTLFLEEVDAAYLELCQTELHWRVLEVVDPASGELCDPEIIHRQLLELLRQEKLVE